MHRVSTINQICAAKRLYIQYGKRYIKDKPLNQFLFLGGVSFLISNPCRFYVGGLNPAHHAHGMWIGQQFMVWKHANAIA